MQPVLSICLQPFMLFPSQHWTLGLYCDIALCAASKHVLSQCGVTVLCDLVDQSTIFDYSIEVTK